MQKENLFLNWFLKANNNNDTNKMNIKTFLSFAFFTKKKVSQTFKVYFEDDEISIVKREFTFNL